MSGLDSIIRLLRRRLTKRRSGSKGASHLDHLIGPMQWKLDGPLNATHARRLNDYLKIAHAIAARSGLKMEDRA